MKSMVWLSGLLTIGVNVVLMFSPGTTTGAVIAHSIAIGFVLGCLCMMHVMKATE